MFGLGQDVYSSVGNGINSMEDWENFAKAAQTSSYQTDHATMTGLAAIRKESLEPTLRAVVAQSDSYTFYKELKRQPVTSAVHEWMSQVSRGGQMDGMNISELGEVQFDVGDYRRHVEKLKMFATGVQITDFANAQGLEGEALRARENENGMVRLAGAIERALLTSNEAYNPNKINGYKAQLTNFEGGRNVINTNGLNDINEVIKLVFQANADVRQEGSYGKGITDIYVDAYTQNSLDENLFKQYRVQLDSHPSSIEYGAPVGGIKTSFGNIGIKSTIWNNNAANTQPLIVKNKGKLPDSCPAVPTITVTPVAAGVAGGATGWTAERAGEYYYYVALTDADGREGPLSVVQSGTVATSGALKIAGQAGPSTVVATGGKLYRSTQDPATVPQPKDCRLSGEFAVNADGSFTYVDVNQYIPGSSSIPAMTLVKEAIQWLQLKPTTQFPLYATNRLVIPWAIVQYGTLMLGQPQQHYLFENVLNPNAPWKPFKAD